MVDPMRLRTIVCCTVIAAAFAFPGCSIHPLPGDIPRVPTSDIVERIRCEAQEGLRSFSQEDPDIRRIVQRVIRGTTIAYEFAFKITEHNDAICSRDFVRNMRARAFELVRFHSDYMTLHPGDLISTGCPKGARIQAGDRVRARIEGVGILEARVTASRRRC